MSDCVTRRITRTRPVRNRFLPRPRLTISYLTMQYQRTLYGWAFVKLNFFINLCVLHVGVCHGNVVGIRKDRDACILWHHEVI